jgi:hypothetical protein
MLQADFQCRFFATVGKAFAGRHRNSYITFQKVGQTFAVEPVRISRCPMLMRHLFICACLAATFCALNGPALAASGEQPTAADEQLGQRVEAALHSDPYFYDKHVTVSVEKGNVVLRGFVTSDWDLLDAIRIAGKAAGGRRVLNYLEITLGGFK